MVEIRSEVNFDDISQLKRHANKLSRLTKSISICNYFIFICARAHNFLDKTDLLNVFVLTGQLEVGPGKDTAPSIIMAVRPPGFRTAVREIIEYKKGKKDPDQVMATMHCLKAA